MNILHYSTVSQFKHVPNNSEGQTFIKVLRQLLKNTPQTIVVRGRGPRKPHVGIDGRSHRNLRQDLPLKVATHFTVYIMKRPTIRRHTITSGWVPTKWARS